jgi:hypothetical protein
MEEGITGDFAFVKAWKGDEEGNLIFRFVQVTAFLVDTSVFREAFLVLRVHLTQYLFDF